MSQQSSRPNHDSSPSLVRWFNSGVLYRKGSARCPVCGDRFAPGAEIESCARCETPHHADCWTWNGRCGLYGCARGGPIPWELARPSERPPPGRTYGPVARVDLAQHDRDEQAEVAATRPGITLFELLVVIAIIGVLAAIAVPKGHHGGRERANTMACYTNQKMVAGALEMYNLDKNTKVTRLDAGQYQLLKSGGYLRSIPDDPGQGAGTADHYGWTGSGNSIRCRLHGSIQ